MSKAVDTARTYAIIGFIFYLIAFIVGIVGSLVAMMAMAFHFMMGVGLMFPLVFFIPGIIFAVWSWITIKDIDTGKYSEARTYSLILGILGLFFAWLIGGIFFLLAYGKLGEITTQPTVQQPQRFCIQCGRAVPTDAKYCPHCGKELPQ